MTAENKAEPNRAFDTISQEDVCNTQWHWMRSPRRGWLKKINSFMMRTTSRNAKTNIPQTKVLKKYRSWLKSPIPIVKTSIDHFNMFYISATWIFKGFWGFFSEYNKVINPNFPSTCVILGLITDPRTFLTETCVLTNAPSHDTHKIQGFI